LTIVYGILCLGFLVFFHELGHFLAARAFGVAVESFSVGMVPVILHHTWGGTDYRLSLIPLGGYCGMKGQKDYPVAPNKGAEQESSAAVDKDSFYGVHPFKRLLIAFNGPFFNLIFAFIAYFIIALMGYTYYSAGTKVSMTSDTAEYATVPSPAKAAGMKSGDDIQSINGKKMNDFSDIVSYVSLHGDENITITALRNGELLTFTVHTGLDKSSGSGKLGIVSDSDSVIERTYPKHSFFPAIGEGLKQTGSMIGLSFKSIGILFKGVDLTKTVSGPARITTMLGDTVKNGFSAGIHAGVVSTLEFLAILSISLFIMNLLPIPVLDGGLILFSFIECITKRRISPKVQFYVQLIGIAFILLLLALALTGDIQYFISQAKTK